jgi:hypothetical protein
MAALQEAIEIQEGDTKVDKTMLLTEAQIVDLSGGFVRYDAKSGFVYFSNNIVRNFLAERSRSDQHYLLTEVEIAKICLMYLLFPELDREIYESSTQGSKKRDIIKPLARYAARNWAKHAKGRGERDGMVQDLVKQLCSSSSKMQALSQLVTFTGEGHSKKNVLHVLVENDLTELAEVLWDMVPSQSSLLTQCE